MDRSDPQVSRALLGLTRYLGELVRASDRPVRNIRDETVVWLSDLPEGVARVEARPDGRLLQLEQEVPRPAPEPPAVCADRVQGTIHDPEAVLSLLPLETAAVFEPDAEPQRREADPAGMAFDRWHETWLRWAAQERGRRNREKLRRKVSAIARRLDLNGDSVELVLAVGLLRWRSPRDDEVVRHLVTIRAQASVDAKTGRVDVALAEDAALVLEDRLFLDDLDGFVPAQTDPVRTALAEAGHPLTRAAADGLRMWAAQGLEAPAVFSEEWRRSAGAAPDGGLVSLAPALVVRERGRNRLVEFYGRIEEALSGVDPQVPLGWAQLLFAMTPQERLTWRSSDGGGAAAPILTEEPLFPLPLNEAQRKVFDKLVKDTALVVEGPPGTGKTHTIANLLSALLAQGKRVLVTSMRDRALEVLFDDKMLPPPLQHLCVRMAHHRGPGRDELGRTIERLAGAAADRDVDQLSADIGILRKRRTDLLGQEAVLSRRLGDLVAAETYALDRMPVGYEGTRADAAEAVVAGEPRHGWIADFSSSHEEAPLGLGECWELSDLLSSFDGDDRPGPSHPPADVSGFPTAERFSGLVAAAGVILPDEEPAGRFANALTALPSGDLEALLQQVADAQALLDTMDGAADGWRAEALTAALQGRTRSWARLRDQTREAAEHADRLADISGHGIQIPEVSGAEAVQRAASIEAYRDHLRAGRRQRPVFRSRVQTDAEHDLYQCAVDGRPANTPETLDMIATAFRASAALSSLKEQWHRAAGPPLAEGTIARQLEELVDRSVDLDRITDLAAALDGLRRQLTDHYRPAAHASWPLLQQAILLAGAYRDRAAATSELAALNDLLPDQPSSGAIHALRTAIRSHDSSAYPAALRDIAAEERRYRDARRRDDLLARVHAAQPSLAGRLAKDGHQDPWKDRLRTLGEAWAWAQARSRLTGTSHTDDITTAQSDLDRVEQALQKTTGQLAADQAWRHCLTRMTPQQRSALIAFGNRVSELGKGTGRYSSRHRRSAADAMSIARQAVPVWVMPLAKVVETIAPVPDSFDVIIVDEASQLPIEAVFLLWLAPHVIVVGDDKQCSPPMTGRGELQPIYDRIDEFLPDVTDAFRDDFTPKSNLYRLLNVRFPGSQRLTDHHRSMPEIIGWSSRTFYDNDLTPVRQFGTDRLQPLCVVHVDDGYIEGRGPNRSNPAEATQIAVALKRMFADPAYAGKTFGVISLVGQSDKGHVAQLEKQIDEHIPDQAEREARRLRVGTAPDFQGDQRDVILLSMLDVGRPPRTQGSVEWERQRWNVATTRARDQMWLFTSTTLNDLSRDDLRHSLLTHMLTPPPPEQTPEHLAAVTATDLHEAFDSLFEQRVFLRIRDRGYHVIPQYPVGRKLIDLVVVGDQRRLAVECDGRHWHTGPERIAADLARERVLRRAGWTFCRVREGDFILDPDQALLPLWERLNHLGIHPTIHQP